MLCKLHLVHACEFHYRKEHMAYTAGTYSSAISLNHLYFALHTAYMPSPPLCFWGGGGESISS